MVKDLIKLENRGRSTYVSVAGINVSRGISGISFNQQVENVNDPSVTATINIREILQVLSEITPEQFEEAKEIIKPYLDGNKQEDDTRSIQEAILPCKCGNALHRKDAIYCSKCGRILEKRTADLENEVQGLQVSDMLTYITEDGRLIRGVVIDSFDK